MTIFLIILAVLGLVIIAGILINKTLAKTDFAGVTPYGKQVNVDSKRMHVHSMGNGERTIVVLPGMGSPLPSAEFAPLMRGLHKTFPNDSIAVVEYFGYGHSDQTNTPRTNENYMQEIRAALKAAGHKPPYVLMPHSASGIYSEYYATKHPEEVAAIIMLDTTSSAEKSDKTPGFLRHVVKAQAFIGLERLNARLIAKILGINAQNGYTPTEIHDYKQLSLRRHNDTVLAQMFFFHNNVAEVMDMPFAEHVPVLYLNATAKGMDEYKAKHMARLGKNAQSVTLKGNHMLHIKTWEDILPEAEKFLNQL